MWVLQRKPKAAPATTARAVTPPLMQADGQAGDISAQDLAIALVDALEQSLHLRQRFTVAY